jgi:hypothetical protein
MYMVLEHSTTVLKSEKIKGDPKTTVSEIMDRCKLVQYIIIANIMTNLVGRAAY